MIYNMMIDDINSSIIIIYFTHKHNRIKSNVK
nr:MAG TPA: hypothetical protein [Caudoviricetes sp.]